MKKIIFLFAALLAGTLLSAQSNLVSEYELYPVHSDRSAWSKINVVASPSSVSAAERGLEREWTPIMFSDWNNYRKTGDEACMGDRVGNQTCLEGMIIMELLGGSGKYLLRIADYAWLQSTCPYWNAYDVILEKAVVHYFREEFDELDPSICETILKAVRKNKDAK